MPKVACQIETVPELLGWTRALAQEAQEALRRGEVPASLQACRVWLGRCNEVMEATARLCGPEAERVFRPYDLCRVPADNLLSKDLESYLDHAAGTLKQVGFYLEQKVRWSHEESKVQPTIIACAASR